MYAFLTTKNKLIYFGLITQEVGNLNQKLY